MTRALVVGNSGSGKSTLAARLAQRDGLAHLDLDPLAWLPTTPPSRRPIAQSAREIEAFIAAHPAWVIEGCYADLLDLVTAHATRLVFLNPGVEACIANARARPWEPHKYASLDEQNRMFDALQAWVVGYYTRDDAWSYQAHRRIFEAYDGPKREMTDGATDVTS